MSNVLLFDGRRGLNSERGTDGEPAEEIMNELIR